MKGRGRGWLKNREEVEAVSCEMADRKRASIAFPSIRTIIALLHILCWWKREKEPFLRNKSLFWNRLVSSMFSVYDYWSRSGNYKGFIAILRKETTTEMGFCWDLLGGLWSNENRRSGKDWDSDDHKFIEDTRCPQMKHGIKARGRTNWPMNLFKIEPYKIIKHQKAKKPMESASFESQTEFFPNSEDSEKVFENVWKWTFEAKSLWINASSKSLFTNFQSSRFVENCSLLIYSILVEKFKRISKEEPFLHFQMCLRTILRKHKPRENGNPTTKTENFIFGN